MDVPLPIPEIAVAHELSLLVAAVAFFGSLLRRGPHRRAPGDPAGSRPSPCPPEPRDHGDQRLA